MGATSELCCHLAIMKLTPQSECIAKPLGRNHFFDPNLPASGQGLGPHRPRLGACWRCLREGRYSAKLLFAFGWGLWVAMFGVNRDRYQLQRVAAHVCEVRLGCALLHSHEGRQGNDAKQVTSLCAQTP